MSKFSDFIRNATPEEKAEVYAEVMKAASERQVAFTCKVRCNSAPEDRCADCPNGETK